MMALSGLRAGHVDDISRYSSSIGHRPTTRVGRLERATSDDRLSIMLVTAVAR